MLRGLVGQLKQSQSVGAKLAGAALAGAQNITRTAAEGIATSHLGGGAGASLAEAAFSKVDQQG